jgi:hypothetical protein
MDFDICNIYNLNLINLNKLINEKIVIDVSNFLYENNLIDLYYKHRDYKKITNHFIIKNILETINQNYNNIFLYKKDINFDIYINKISKLLNLNLFEIEEIPILLDQNLIYRLKCLAENKKPLNFKKINQFCQKNDLKEITERIKNNPKTKLVLYK